MRVPLRATIGAHDHNSWTQILDKMPSCTSDSKKIKVITYVAEDVECGVMLKKKIHFNANAANILEHIRKLHMFGV